MSFTPIAAPLKPRIDALMTIIWLPSLLPRSSLRELPQAHSLSYCKHTIFD